MREVFHDYIYYIVFCALTGLLTLTACTQQPTNVADSDALPAVFPDYVGVTIPVGIAPMNFSMDGARLIDVKAGMLLIDLAIGQGWEHQQALFAKVVHQHVQHCVWPAFHIANALV